MRSFKTSSVAVFTAVLALTCGTGFAAKAPPATAPVATPAVALPQPSLVATTYGPVQGVPAHLPGVTMWLGIPYATPPVGERRWQAPIAPTPWTQPLVASSYGSPCVQMGSLYGPPPKGKPWGMANLETYGKTVGSEDCLTLNVWRPENAGPNLPVLVFVHGGSGVIGHSGDPIYDGANLAVKAKAVVVTINYRLNLLGAFLHPSLTYADAASSSGNYATLDTIQSLRFVHDNAQRFGGDPQNVTLMGQSAGGAMVYKVMGSKLATGLFQKAFVLSAAIVKSDSREKGAAFADALLAQLAVTDALAKDTKAAAALLKTKDKAWTRAYLMAKPAGELVAAWRNNIETMPALPGNFGDGVVMPSDLPAAYKAGEFIRVPTLIGHTRDEAKLLTPNVLKGDWPDRFTMMVQPRAPGSEPLSESDLLKPWLMSSWTHAPYNTYMWGINKLLFWLVGVNSSIADVAKYSPAVYAYRFDWDNSPEPWHTVWGAGHSMDLPFLFGNFAGHIFSLQFTPQNLAGSEALSNLMQGALAAFLHSGDPNVPGLPLRWLPLGSDADFSHKLVFDADDKGLCGPKGCDD